MCWAPVRPMPPESRPRRYCQRVGPSVNGLAIGPGHHFVLRFRSRVRVRTHPSPTKPHRGADAWGPSRQPLGKVMPVGAMRPLPSSAAHAVRITFRPGGMEAASDDAERSRDGEMASDDANASHDGVKATFDGTESSHDDDKTTFDGAEGRHDGINTTFDDNHSTVDGLNVGLHP